MNFRVFQGLVVLGVATSFFSPSPAQAKHWTLEKAEAAAQKGNAEAQYILAKSYAKGNGVKQDFVQSAAFMREAAEKGYASAQNDLGAMYARGQGVEQNY